MRACPMPCTPPPSRHPTTPIGGGQGGPVAVDATIDGATGFVVTAQGAGGFASTETGACAARAVRGARFPRFRAATLPVRAYPFTLE